MKTLKSVLLVNALSSGVTGLGLIVFAAPIAVLFGIGEPTPVMEVGIFLVVFAIFVFREGRRTIYNLRMINFGYRLGHRKYFDCAVATFQFDAACLLRDQRRSTLGIRNGLPANKWNEAADHRVTCRKINNSESFMILNC
jgi:hypothetical protein